MINLKIGTQESSMYTQKIYGIKIRNKTESKNMNIGISH